MRTESLAHFAARLPAGRLWIFGYGSLMWSPEFEYIHRRPVRLFGFHRALCVRSPDHRGAAQRPGLVMGLARGGSCHGMAFLVPRRRVSSTLRRLWQREMPNASYLPRLLTLTIGTQRARALAFVADPRHSNYAGRLSVEDIARRVLACRGERGSNLDYLLNTVSHLEAMGVRDRHLTAVLSAARLLAGRARQVRSLCDEPAGA